MESGAKRNVMTPRLPFTNFICFLRSLQGLKREKDINNAFSHNQSKASAAKTTHPNSQSQLVPSE